MEFYVSRAMEIGRMTVHEVGAIHHHEKKIGRALCAHELQEVLKKVPLKDHYEVPDDDASEARHTLRIKADLKRLLVAPEVDLSPFEVEIVHRFDGAVFDLVVKVGLNLSYQSGRNVSSLRSQLK